MKEWMVKSRKVSTPLSVRFSPTLVIDGGGAQHIRRGHSSPIRLVFWVELDPRPWYVVGSGGPRPDGHRLMGIARRARFRCTLTLSFLEQRSQLHYHPWSMGNLESPQSMRV